MEMLLAISDLLCVIAGSKATAMECLEAMASGLYSELFTILISLINRLVFSIQCFSEAEIEDGMFLAAVLYNG